MAVPLRLEWILVNEAWRPLLFAFAIMRNPSGG